MKWKRTPFKHGLLWADHFVKNPSRHGIMDRIFWKLKGN